MVTADTVCEMDHTFRYNHLIPKTFSMNSVDDRMIRHELTQPLKMTLSVTDRCSLNCAHCYGRCHNESGSRELDTAAWLRIIDEAIDAGVITFLIEGGEPLLRPDLFEILHHIRGRALVWLRTHAQSLSPSLAAALDDAEVGTVCVDVFGASAATHDAHSGRDGSFARTIEAIGMLRAVGLDILPLLILTRRNRPDLQRYVDHMAGLGLRQASVLRLYPLGRAADHWSELACSRDEMLESLSDLKAPAGFRLLHSWHPRNGNCCWESAAVMADGRSVGCPYLRDFVDYGSLHDVTFMDTWHHPLHKRLRAGPVQQATCTTCSSHEGTRGGCRSTAYAFTRDWDAQDPFCPHPTSKVDIRALPNWTV
jgi:radical SAM protein with 4Fe4S-binding SPASM domain